MKSPAPARAVAARVLRRVERDQAFADITLDHELARFAIVGAERRPGAGAPSRAGDRRTIVGAERRPGAAGRAAARPGAGAPAREASELKSPGRAGDPTIHARDVALATELVYGTLRWQRYLDWILSPHSRRPIAALDVEALVALRLAAYQLVFLERVPAFAAVNDAVALARRPGSPGLAAFVNAVLRSFARASARDREPSPPSDPVEALALRWSFPTWLAARWVERYGPDQSVSLMRAMNERPPMTVRTNTLLIMPDALAERLRAEEGLASRRTPYAPEGLVLEHGGTPGSWQAFTAGALAIQDEASMLVTHLVAPRAGETVADVCAAPGTKTTHLAQLMENRGRLVAFDSEPTRLARLTEASARLGVTMIEQRPGSVEALAPDFGAICDHVLIDAPCSNLGVVRRNPEVKWRRQPADLAASANRQRSILAAASTMVKPGGHLVYATCSLEPEENDDVVRWFLESHPEFRPDPPADFPLAFDSDAFLRCRPDREGTDGFTAIRCRRRG